LHFTHALLWRFFHSFGLGAALRAQSENKFLVRHYMKHYFYPRDDIRKGALEEAFANWKSMYNMSLCMTYGEVVFKSRVIWPKLITLMIASVSFIALAWKTYTIPQTWSVGDQLLRHILGVVR